MAGKSIIIIGAGIAGLSAGCYAQMNGYDSRIFEMHKKSGGLCAAWRRGDYTFDGCIHWLMGSGPGTVLYDWWRELGALQDRKIVDHEYFTRFVGKDGREVVFYSNPDKLEQHLIELAPSDTAAIKELASDIRALTRDFPSFGKPQELVGKLDLFKVLLKNLPYLRTTVKYNRITVKQLSERFSDPLLQEAFLNFFSHVHDEAATGVVMTMATFNMKSAGYPIGGSRPFAKAIEQRYYDLGGEIEYKKKVAQILVEDNAAVGVRLEDGSEYRSDVVISAADGRTTIFDMLGGAYVDEGIRKIYNEFKVWPSAVQISLGVARDLAAEPHAQTLYLNEPITFGNDSHRYMRVRHFAYDPTMAPEGKTVITILFEAGYEYWQELKDRDRALYSAEKERLLAEAIQRLEAYYPGIGADIEISDVATPATFTRYTGTWKGSFMAWLDTPEANAYAYSTGIPRRLPGLDGFYHIGQWVSVPGGLPTGLMGGREIIQLQCHKDKRQFVTTIP